MGLRGLEKKANPVAADTADDFIGAAKVKDGPSAKASKAKFKRVTFSLDEDIDDKINALSLVPRGFRATRSDVVRAAVELLSSHPDVEKLIEKAKKNE
jgi:hypothetical protein